jgi:hypothetical protein
VCRMVGMYECELCAYSTNRKDSFSRHQNSKRHLLFISGVSDHVSENVVPFSENVVPNSENVVPNSENVVPNSENVVPFSENVSHPLNSVVFLCQKCNKSYKKKEYLQHHEKECTGVDSLTCPRCMKTFASRKTKSKHCKRNKCKPVSIFEAENVKQIINNNTNQSYNTNSLNTTNNNTNINIYINDYGKERKDYLWAYDNFYDIIRVPNNNILVKYLRCKNFNPLFPENHCIKYENRCFKLKENNRWRLINPTALKDKLYYDCGSEVLHVFDENKEKIRQQILTREHFDAVKKKSSFIDLELEGYGKEIKNSMLDVVKETS